jgi:cell fate regulator YaaT (PSP1 superfamily)
MGCSSCGSGGSPDGCGNKGHCSSGGCNKRNTYDWISDLDIHDPNAYDIVEVSFKQGARKDFFRNKIGAVTGDIVVVDAGSGYDIGHISLSGELVRLQMRKKRAKEDRVQYDLLRIANARDLEKLEEARQLERPTLVKARVIARSIGLDMKVGDIEYQADKRKATFFYTAEGRIDFRELVRSYAKEFRIKVEMRQIGARQESARIGGIGSCGRELCCSTWLSDFKSVSTTAARYQNLSLNQSKLSGQCGRLKCCLNYELDSYMDALSSFPKKANYIKTKKGKATLVKTNIFKGLMFYSYVDPKNRGPLVALDKEDVRKILWMNKQDELPEDLLQYSTVVVEDPKEDEIEFADVTGEIELPDQKKKRGRGKGRRNKSSRSKGRNNKQSSGQPKAGRNNKPGDNKPGDKPSGKGSGNRRRGRGRNQRNKNKGNGGGAAKSE